MVGLAQGHSWFVAEQAWNPHEADGWGLPRAKVGPGLAAPGYVTPAGTARVQSRPRTEKQGQAAGQLGHPRT